jgi:hypothetical protein
VVATVPEILKNVNNLEGLLSLAGGVKGQGTLMNELEQAPIEVISMRGSAGNGQVRLQQSLVQSSAFEAQATGPITLNTVLANSAINIPVTVSLSQPIANQLSLPSTSAGGNGVYTPLPKFLTITGTIGNPKAKIDKLAIAGSTVRAIGKALLNQTNSPVGNLLNGLLKGR